MADREGRGDDMREERRLGQSDRRIKKEGIIEELEGRDGVRERRKIEKDEGGDRRGEDAGAE